MSKESWLIAEIAAHHHNLLLFEKRLNAEEIERLETEAENVTSEHIKKWCRRKIEELQ